VIATALLEWQLLLFGLKIWGRQQSWPFFRWYLYVYLGLFSFGERGNYCLDCTDHLSARAERSILQYRDPRLFIAFGSGWTASVCGELLLYVGVYIINGGALYGLFDGD
jgi:hypothetical protein